MNRLKIILFKIDQRFANIVAAANNKKGVQQFAERPFLLFP